MRSRAAGDRSEDSRGETVARFEAEVERLLKRGSLERMLVDVLLEVDGGGVYMGEVAVDEVGYVDGVPDESVDNADEMLDRSLDE